MGSLLPKLSEDLQPTERDLLLSIKPAFALLIFGGDQRSELPTNSIPIAKSGRSYDEDAVRARILPRLAKQAVGDDRRIFRGENSHQPELILPDIPGKQNNARAFKANDIVVAPKPIADRIVGMQQCCLSRRHSSSE